MTSLELALIIFLSSSIGIAGVFALAKILGFLPKKLNDNF